MSLTAQKVKKNLTPPPHPAVGCFRAHNFKSRGISSTAEKIDTLLVKPSLHSPGRGSFREHDFKVTKFKNVSRNAIILSDYTTNIAGEAG